MIFKASQCCKLSENIYQSWKYKIFHNNKLTELAAGMLNSISV